MSAKSTAAADRMISVDALRGFDMFWIIGGAELVKGLLGLIINPLPRAVEFQFEHVEWIGFTAWDIIMPLFLFIVGTSLPFSMSKRLATPADRLRVYRRILKRFVVLFILGIAVQGNLLSFDLSRLHVFCNTLQAIAVGYTVAAVLLMNAGTAVQAGACAVLLIGYWALLRFVPAPGMAAGTLLPDANLAMYIDELLLGRFRDGTTYTWILSGLGFAATVLLGVMSGHVLRSGLVPLRKCAALAGAGLACLAGGWLWSLDQPIIKHIWTSSFVLWSGGWCFLLLALFYLILDILGVRRWAFFFIVIGSNALFVYCFSGIIGGSLPHSLTDPLKALPESTQAIIGGGVFIALWLLLYIMYRKKIFLRV